MEEYINTYSLIGKISKENDELFQEVIFQKIYTIFEEKKVSFTLEIGLIILSYSILISSLLLIHLF